MHGHTDMKLTIVYLVAKLRGRFTAGSESTKSPTAVATEFVPDCVLPCFVHRAECSGFLYLNYILFKYGKQHKDSEIIT